MPTQKYFDKFPPFPEDVPFAPLPCLSFDKLQKQDESESAILFDACRALGFFLLDFRGNHEGEEFLKKAETMFQITEDVNGMDHDHLMKFHAKPPKDLHGYKTFGVTKNELGNPDRLTFYTILQDDMLGNFPPRSNPTPIESNRSVITAYMQQASTVSLLICAHLEKHLRLPPGTFAGLQPQSKCSGTAVRMLRYPPQPPEDRQTSLIGHTDIGTVTLLFNVTGGLQILPPGLDPKDQKSWAYVRPQPGCAIVNIGDAMVEWSAGILRSNMHRVTWAPGAQGDVFRYSMAYLCRAAGDSSMKRLAGPGADGAKSLIPELEDGEEDSQLVARDWETAGSLAIQQGKVSARSKGGRNLEGKPELAALASKVVSAVGA